MLDDVHSGDQLKDEFCWQQRLLRVPVLPVGEERIVDVVIFHLWPVLGHLRRNTMSGQRRNVISGQWRNVTIGRSFNSQSDEEHTKYDVTHCPLETPAASAYLRNNMAGYWVIWPSQDFGATSVLALYLTLYLTLDPTKLPMTWTNSHHVPIINIRCDWDVFLYHLVHSVEHIARHNARRFVFRLADRHPNRIESVEAMIEVLQVFFVKSSRYHVIFLQRKRSPATPNDNIVAVVSTT